jgi:adenylate cyclase
MNTEEFKRRLTAILSADVEGYSRLMREDEEATIRTLKTYRTEMRNLIQRYRGRVVDSPGDNIMAEFASVVDAVNCAVEIQRELAERNTDLTSERRMQFRIGVNLGDVVEDGERIYGDGVNIAARMESLAEGGGICISGIVYDQVKHKLGLEYEFLGEQEVKNIAEPVPAYRLLSFPGAAAHRVIKAKRAVRKTWRNLFVATVAILVVGAAVAVWHFSFRHPPMEVASVERMALPLPDKPSIAVLPFVNMSGDPEQEYFSDGITEQIITGLSKVPKLFVIARNSTFTYKGKPVKVQKVAEELGVRYVLEGSVQRSAERIRITTQLIDAITAHHLWAERYDRELKDIFALQDEITMKIITALQVELTEGDIARMHARGTENLQAYEKLLKGGEYFYHQNKDDNILARKIAEEVIALDPGYPAGYNLLAWTHYMDVWFRSSKSPKESLSRAYELAQKVVAMDDSLVMPHILLGHIYVLKRQHEKAIAENERAITLSPNAASGYAALGRVLNYAGRPEEAIPLVKKAIRLDPLPESFYYYTIGLAYNMTGRYDESIEACEKAIKAEPNSLYAHVVLAAAYSLSGQEEEAHAETEEVLRIHPKFSLEYFGKTLPYKNPTDRENFIAALRKAGLPETPPLPLPDKPSIAVLPFVNMSGDPEQEYFSDGITEEIITALSKTPKLFVIARNSSFTYKGKSVWIPKVGRELGVKYLLEGSVRKAGDKVRITAQLIDAKTNQHIWAERYDRELKHIFALQDEITMNVIKALELKITEGEQALIYGGGTNNLEAYLKFLQAFEYARRMNPDDNQKARRIFEEAIGLDPNYAVAYRLLGATHMMDVWLGTTRAPRESLRKAAELSRKALALDESLGTAHAMLGHIYILMRDYDKGIEVGQKAVELEPNGADSHAFLGMGLRFADRPEEAIKILKKAIRLNPMPQAWYLHNLAMAYRNMGRFDEAIGWAKKAVDRQASNVFSHLVLASSYSLAGREEEAQAEATQVLRINPKFSLEQFAKTAPQKNPEVKKRLIDSLRKAGLK